ncbi:heterokaryon incompatibility protein-domain-containing protein, partial [Apodospora peruviana]
MTRVILFKVNRVVRWAARPVEGWVEPEWAVEFGELLPPESEYQYGDLRPAQIRLLRLLPGRHPEPIRCRLEVSDLDSQLSFEAISYVWGKGKFDRFVVVDGKRLNVMESAYSVLQRRRSRRVERVLWIDQICINQADIVERASQVRVMKELYASADRVVAWLGHSESAHLVQSFFGELQYQQEGLGFTGEELRNAAGRGGGAKWQALCEFLRNEWFTRIWIIQEATFSRELHLLYGDVCMDWDLVGEAIPALWHWDMLQSIPALDGNADTMLEFRGDVDYGRIFNVFTALENCVGFRCSEPRDKIYALTNIFDDVRITPDYGIPVAKLFTQIMLDILKKGNSLDAIAWAGTGFGARAIEDLPSWVPDWN